MTKPAPTIKLLTLSHPTTGNPTQARQVGYYCEGGRAIGLKLDFGDGKPVQMRYERIAELREEAEKEPQP